ncbi:MAG: 16S rRNA (cytosine(1402)-N(4))-methyltransferase RsmH [Phycisphaerae bacterium]|nr:16S rRNA (cytosine(1402)-N(4))-methyltransferase RsmH [Phycisphaerae bacterium]
MDPSHVPVLVSQVCVALAAAAERLLVDCTVGLAGHTQELLRRTPPSVRLLGLDVDDANLGRAAEILRPYSGRFDLVRANFSEIGKVLAERGLGTADGLIADLGVSSNQLDDPSRGLSFESDGPLDMRLDRRSGLTAADLVNDLSEKELADLLYLQAQERHSRRIARAICEARRSARIESTLLLARLVANAVGVRPADRRGRIHPATRTFLALRIAVNHETECLTALLRQIPDVLRPGGRAALISFQSTEDRLIKESFRRLVREGRGRVLYRRGLVPDRDEIERNPRSRSARLRVLERCG